MESGLALRRRPLISSGADGCPATYGVPTRMLDFTFNPLIALWFATGGQDRIDGRVFAVDVADREISPSRAASRDPWWHEEPGRLSVLGLPDRGFGSRPPSRLGVSRVRTHASSLAGYQLPPQNGARRSKGLGADC